MTDLSANISFQQAVRDCIRSATNRPGFAAYDCVVVGSGKKRTIFDRPYFAQRREIALKLGNPIVWDPKAEKA